PSCSSATGRSPAVTCPASTSTSRSATGNSPASSRVCTRATPTARWESPPTASKPSRRKSFASQNRRRQRSSGSGNRVALLYELIERPELDAPVLILALDGWIDAGLGAANARASLLNTMAPRTVARFDSDELLDHRARRPTMHLVEGVVTGMT